MFDVCVLVCELGVSFVRVWCEFGVSLVCILCVLGVLFGVCLMCGLVTGVPPLAGPGAARAAAARAHTCC